MKLEDLLKEITPLPLRTSEMRSVCARMINNAADTHRSIFDATCGNCAHVFKDADALYYAHAANFLPELLSALKSAHQKLAIISSPDTRWEDCSMRHLRDLIQRVEEVPVPE
jgi:hypothetical protein